MSLRPPNSIAVVSYSYTIFANGIPIGTLQRLSKSEERASQIVTEVRRTPRDVREILMGRTSYTIEAERVKTYTKNVLQAFGFVYSDIGQITTPIQIIEHISLPDGFTMGAITGLDVITEGVNAIRLENDIVNVYLDCWPTRRSDTVAVEQTLITESVSFASTGPIPIDITSASDVVGRALQGIF